MSHFENFYYHAIIAAFISYFIVSILRRDFILMAGFTSSRFRGTKAILYASGFLLFIWVVIIPVFNQQYQEFSITMLGYGFIIGLPIAFIIHSLLKKWYGP